LTAALVLSPPRPIAHLHIDPTEPRVAHVLVYSSGNAAFAVGTEAPRVRHDTLRIHTPANLTADLSVGDVHVVAVEASDLNLTVTLHDAPASKLTAIGRHLVVERGGTGVHPQR